MGTTVQAWLQVVIRTLQGTRTVPDPNGAPPTGIPTPAPQAPLSLQLAQEWDSLEPAQLFEGGLATGVGWGQGTEEGLCMPAYWQAAWADGSSLLLTLSLPGACKTLEREISTLTSSPTDTEYAGPGGHQS